MLGSPAPLALTLGDSALAYLARETSKLERLLAKGTGSSVRRVELAGKRFLVTGATGGLGRAIAAALAAQGSGLILSARREPELRELAGSLPGGADRHSVVVSDLATPDAAERLVAEAGELDGLVANAAMHGTGRLERLGADEVKDTLRVNLEAPILMTQALVPRLIERGEGQIVLIGSLNGKAATPRSSIYCATKFGLRGFALALREDLLPHGVGVSLVSPGFVRDAGMFHESGTQPPPGLGTTTPGEVGRGVVRAIRENRSEVEVATRRLRTVVAFAHRRPELAARVQRRGGADKIAEKLSEGHSRRG
jgi:short-subunit dehydrogenase